MIAFVVLFVGAGVYGVVNNRAANMTPEDVARQMAEDSEKNAPQPAPGTAPATPSAEQVAQQVKSATAAGGESADPRPSGRPGGPPAAPAIPGSSIVAPKATPYKPVPNESATSSQWYQKGRS